MKARYTLGDEKKRLETLLALRIMDTQREQDYDDIVELTAQICGTPIALISLIDDQRQWFKAKVGLTFSETPKEHTFCSYTILQTGVMIVPDAMQDQRFLDNPLVTGAPNIRFYAGVPLTMTGGYNVGTLCVIDTQPRELSERQIHNLRILGGQVIKLLERRTNDFNRDIDFKALLALYENLEHAEEQAKVGSWKFAIDNTERSWSRQMFRFFDLKPESGVPDFPILLERIHPLDRQSVLEAGEKLLRGEIPTLPAFRTNPEVGPLKYLLSTVRFIKDSTGRNTHYEGTIHDVTEQKNTEQKLLESEARLQTIIQSGPECIKILGPDSELLDMNPAGLSIIDADNIEQVRGQCIAALVSSPYRKAFLQLIKEVFLGNAGTLQFEISSLKGAIRWIETRAVPMRDSEGKIISLLGISFDITEQKKNEIERHNAEDRFRSIFENAIDGIFQSTPNGKFITANEAMARIYGYDSASQLLEQVTDISAQLSIDPFTRAKIADEIRRNGKAIGLELQTTKKNKELIWVLANIRSVYDNQAEISHFEGTVKDITKQKKAEQQIRKEKDLAEHFINSLPGIFYLYNRTGKFLRWNSNFETITGYDANEIALMRPADFFKEGQERNLALSAIDQVWNIGYSDLETNFLLKNGSKIPYYFNGWKIEYENEPCLIGVGIDISDRKAAEEDRRNSENKLRAFFRSTPDASILLSPTFDVLSYNFAAGKLALETYGHELKEGDNIIDLTFPELRREIQDLFTSALRGETRKAELHLPNIQTNEKYWWEGTFMPAYDIDRVIFGVVANLRNIDEMKRTQLRLTSQFEELQKTNKELDQFVYSASHDIRAPLTTILGLVNVAELDAPSAVFKRHLDMIRQSIRKLDGFTRDILNYSRNSRTSVVQILIDFNEIINSVLEDTSAMEGAKRLDINIIQEGIGVPFFSDKTRLEVVFANLISNAIKYQDYEKKHPWLKIRMFLSREHANIYISDNGIGIHPDYISKIFDMFYRASENAKGAGLGLYIVRETVHKLGGTISVKSKFKQSTEFHICIPNGIVE